MQKAQSNITTEAVVDYRGHSILYTLWKGCIVHGWDFTGGCETHRLFFDPSEEENEYYAYLDSLEYNDDIKEEPDNVEDLSEIFD